MFCVYWLDLLLCDPVLFALQLVEDKLKPPHKLMSGLEMSSRLRSRDGYGAGLGMV